MQQKEDRLDAFLYRPRRWIFVLSVVGVPVFLLVLAQGMIRVAEMWGALTAFLFMPPIVVVFLSLALLADNRQPPPPAPPHDQPAARRRR